jgi:sulfotransferase family protein
VPRGGLRFAVPIFQIQARDVPMTLSTTLLRGADRVAEHLGLARQPMSAEALMETACRRASLAEFGDLSFVEPLRVLLDAYQRESNLSLFGRIGARWDLLRYLVNLLTLQEEERKCPRILDAPVRQPIVITGLPRSGTTFLHRLLAQDPANLVPRCWQTIYPYPGHPAVGPRAGPERVERQLRAFARLVPELRSLHPLDAHSPQECTEITAHSFASLRFDITHEVPSYRRWLAAAGHLRSYRFHRRFLQHLQWRSPAAARWVLKSPDHVFALDAIARVYPDARLVFVHRDPLKVLPSSCRLTEVLRRPFTRQVDRLGIGKQVSDDWAAAAARLVAASDGAGGWPADRALHIHYTALVADPLGTVAAMYRHFGLPLGDAAAQGIRRFVAVKPRGGYGRNSYRFDQYGLDPERERRRFREYMRRFEIAPEAASDPQDAARPGASLDLPSPVRLSHGL